MSGDLKNVIRAAVPRMLRNWLRSPARSAEWLWDAARFSLGSVQTLNFAPECAIVCHPHGYRVARRAQIADPEESAEFRNFLSQCSSSMFLFDLGAHFGMFSLAAAHFGGRAVAVDPSPLATKIMAAQVKLNHCADRVVVVQAAASDKPGELHMLSAGVFSDGYFRLVKGRSQRELTQTPATSVDQMTQQFGSPTHIKIDVEGHEAAVLRGARSTMENRSPMLFLELHNELLAAEGGNPQDALDELERIGYRPFSLNGTALSGSMILERPIVRVVARREN